MAEEVLTEEEPRISTREEMLRNLRSTIINCEFEVSCFKAAIEQYDLSYWVYEYQYSFEEVSNFKLVKIIRRLKKVAKINTKTAKKGTEVQRKLNKRCNDHIYLNYGELKKIEKKFLKIIDGENDHIYEDEDYKVFKSNDYSEDIHLAYEKACTVAVAAENNNIAETMKAGTNNPFISQDLFQLSSYKNMYDNIQSILTYANAYKVVKDLIKKDKNISKNTRQDYMIIYYKTMAIFYRSYLVYKRDACVFMNSLKLRRQLRINDETYDEDEDVLLNHSKEEDSEE